MHGAGMAGDLIVLGLYMIGALAWILFWVMCFFHRQSIFGSISLSKTVGLIAVFLCVMAIGFSATLVETFDKAIYDWLLMLVGVSAPMLGIRAIQSRAR